MKWYTKHAETTPVEGATRLCRHFAWWPVLIAGQKVWMETYEVLQVWDVQRRVVNIEGKDVGFALGSWVNLSKRIIE